MAKVVNILSNDYCSCTNDDDTIDYFEDCIDVTLNDQDACIRFLESYTRDDTFRKISTTHLRVNPYAWNQIAPAYLLNKRLNHVILSAISHKSISLPVWVPECETLHSEFVEPTDRLSVCSTDSVLCFGSRDTDWTFPEMERHDSLHVLVCEGSEEGTTIHVPSDLPAVSDAIVLRNVKLTKESLIHVLAGYNSIDLSDVKMADDVGLNFGICYAQEVRIPASLLCHIHSFPRCRSLTIFLDVLHLDPFDDSFDCVRIDGRVNTTQEYVDVHEGARAAFPHCKNIVIDIRM